ncbi:MAG: MBOAT family protein [Planctomycetes bacterium]|nr:MBOAT family protein [Planctomycetota bacterium]
MLFTSPVFLIFFLVVFGLVALPSPWKLRKFVLMAASFLFYSAWNPPFTLLLVLSTVMDYGLGLAMGATEKQGARRALLIISLIVNLGVLAAFKYANFLSENFIGIAHAVGWDVHLAPWSIVLPVGISFYTFQTLSYTIDVYRKQLKPTRSLIDFGLFVSFFPQLVAGPIVRASEFLPQLDTPKRATSAQLSWAFVLFALGLFKKVFLADALFAPVVEAVYNPWAKLSLMESWVGTYAFAGQIFCDFSGYSDMAIALAMSFGFALPDNFRGPYGSVGFSDFWQRWHLTLSRWLRDYLYIPLGGNRVGKVRVYFNLMLTMLLGGLWHGASWNFVLWGGLHGLFLIGERAVKFAVGRRPLSRFSVFVLALITFHLICIAWVPFRASDFGHTLSMLKSMAGLNLEIADPRLSRWQIATALAGIIAIVSTHIGMRQMTVEKLADKVGWVPTAIAAGIMLFLAVTAGGHGANFIYFQF